MTGGGGPALGVPVAGIELRGGISIGCVLRGGATPDSREEAGGTGVGAVEAGAFVDGRIAVVVGETRGGGTTKLDFFLAISDSTAVSATTAAASEAGTTVAGRRGTVGTGSSFLVDGGGITDVLLAGVGGATGTEPVGFFKVGGTKEEGNGKGATGTEPVGGFAAGEAPVAGGADGATRTEPVGGFNANGYPVDGAAAGTELVGGFFNGTGTTGTGGVDVATGVTLTGGLGAGGVTAGAELIGGVEADEIEMAGEGGSTGAGT
jgi:hypothetical protein